MEALTSEENNTELRSLEIRANDMESGSCMIQAPDECIDPQGFCWLKTTACGQQQNNYGKIVCFLKKKPFGKNHSEKKWRDVTNWKCRLFLFVCFFFLFGDVLTERDRLPGGVERSFELSLFSWKLIERFTPKIAHLVKCSYI